MTDTNYLRGISENENLPSFMRSQILAAADELAALRAAQQPYYDHNQAASLQRDTTFVPAPLVSEHFVGNNAPALGTGTDKPRSFMRLYEQAEQSVEYWKERVSLLEDAERLLRAELDALRAAQKPAVPVGFVDSLVGGVFVSRDEADLYKTELMTPVYAMPPSPEPAKVADICWPLVYADSALEYIRTNHPSVYAECGDDDTFRNERKVMLAASGEVRK